MAINVTGRRSKIEGTDNSETIVGTSSGEDIFGYGGNDVIEGGGGADRIDGGNGFNVVSYANSGAVQIDLSQLVQHGSQAEGDELTNIHGVIGSLGNDFLAGNGGNNTFEGRGGNDTINGAGGSDTVIYANSFAAVQINLNQVLQAGGEAVNDSLHFIENVIGSRHGDTLTGNGEDNRLEGGLGLDTISGGNGKDTLLGGFDRLVDVIDGGANVDTVDYSASLRAMTIVLGNGAVQGTATLNQLTTTHPGINGGPPIAFTQLAVLEERMLSIENVIGTEAGDTITGNGDDNRLEGRGGNDNINAGVGADTLDGGAGADDLNGAGGIDTVTYEASNFEGVQVDLRNGVVQQGGHAQGDELFFIENVIGSRFGNDTITGSTIDNRLDGSGGNDTINGLAGNDVMIGGGGRDTLDGGRNTDTFLYNSVFESGLQRAQTQWGTIVNDFSDTILNFETNIDRIDLSRIDASTASANDQAFRLVSGFSGSAGELTIQGGDIRGDVNGNSVVDLLIHVQGAFDVGDLIL